MRTKQDELLGNELTELDGENWWADWFNQDEKLIGNAPEL